MRDDGVIMETQKVISDIVHSAPRGSVLVLAALEHATLFNGLAAVTSDSGDPVTLLSIDEGLDYLLERKGRRFVSLRQLLPSDAYADIGQLAEQLGGRWNLLNGHDITEFQGVSYAFLVQWEMTFLLARVMKSVVDAQAITSAGLGDTLLIPIRPGLDPMVRHRRRDIMGDQPEAFFADALDQIGGGRLRIRRIRLCGGRSEQRNAQHWRIRFSQAIQRCVVPLLLPLIPGRRVYVQDEYYLGPELMRALFANGRDRIVRESAAGLRDCLRVFRGQGAFHIPPAWFGGRRAREAMRQAARHFASVDWHCVGRAQENGALRFRGLDLGPLLHKKVQFLFEQRFPELAAEQVQLRAWLKRTGIRASVLVEQGMQWSRQVIAAGRPLGMASLCVQHGVTGFRDMGSRHGFVPIVADVTAVWGEIARTWLERAGIRQERLVVVGPPRFDRYPKSGRPCLSANERAAFCARAGIPPADRLILYAESPAQAYFVPNFDHTFQNARTNLDLILNAMRRLPEFRLGIRLRYGSDDPYAPLYHDLVDRRSPDNVSFLPPLPLDESLLHSEFTVVSFSGVGIEALYFDQPVIVVDASGYHRLMQIVEYGAGVLAKSPEEFVAFVRRHDFDPAFRSALQKGRERLLRDQVTLRDGGASRRVVELLNSLIDQGVTATRAAIAARRRDLLLNEPRAAQSEENVMLHPDDVPVVQRSPQRRGRES